MKIGKRGQTNPAILVLGGFLLIYVLAIVFYAGVNNWDFVSGASEVSDTVTSVIGPLFRFLFSTGSNDFAANSFLMVLTFILLSIIIIGTLDSVNMFGNDSTSNRWVNFLIGVIVSLIGIRYMPANIWGSLTAPSSALAATLLFGLPFFALFFVSMKVKSRLVSKLLWIFYLVFLTNIIFTSDGAWRANGFAWIYLAFLFGAIAMMLVDGTVREFFFREKSRMELSNARAGVSLIEKKHIRAEIKELQGILADTSIPQSDPQKTLALTRIRLLEKTYGDLSQF